MPSVRLSTLCTICLLSLSLTLCAPSGTAAQVESQSSSNAVAPGSSLSISGDQSAIGTVVSSRANRLEITDPDGRSRVFALDPLNSYGAAMLPGDPVRVRYDRIEGGTDLAKAVQTLNLSQRMSEEEQARQAYAMSLPATGFAPVAQGSARDLASMAPGTESQGAPGVAEAQEELPATATAMPIVAVAGIILVGAAFGVRRLARRSAKKR